MRVFNARVDPLEDSDDEDLVRDAAPKRRTATETSGTRIKLWLARVDTVEPTMAAMRRFLIALWCVCVVLVGLIIWRVVRSSLRPLDQLKDRIESLDEQASGQRISVPRLPIELAPVVRELNHLLERVETTLKRERTLTSNVAHELRTPIAGILSIIEVTLARLRSPEEYRESTEECFEIAKRMHWLVLNLLSVARIEAKNIQLLNRPLDLKRALIEWWEPFSSRVSARRIQVHWDVPPTAGVETDPEYLRIVVSNLFDNAASYTPDGGSIRITVAPEGRISVANQTPDLKSETEKHVFDPFWRHSPSREDSDLHAGLGLSLCRRIMELLGGRISAEVQESKKMFEVRLEMA
jgi:two-component system heavy metal sensor histidine kinase CusS